MNEYRIVEEDSIKDISIVEEKDPFSMFVPIFNITIVFYPLEFIDYSMGDRSFQVRTIEEYCGSIRHIIFPFSLH